MMFLRFIDELAKLPDGVTAKLFADDVEVIITVDDVAKLQGAITLMNDWTSDLAVTMSVNVCNLLNIGRHVARNYKGGSHTFCPSTFFSEVHSPESQTPPTYQDNKSVKIILPFPFPFPFLPFLSPSSPLPFPSS